jgi:hypothetical protein
VAFVSFVPFVIQSGKQNAHRPVTIKAAPRATRGQTDCCAHQPLASTCHRVSGRAAQRMLYRALEGKLGPDRPMMYGRIFGADCFSLDTFRGGLWLASVPLTTTSPSFTSPVNNDRAFKCPARSLD